ncbi:MAG: hypothetical protein AAF790_01745, partial [Planctomycetota bacterium]
TIPARRLLAAAATLAGGAVIAFCLEAPSRLPAGAFASRTTQPLGADRLLVDTRLPGGKQRLDVFDVAAGRKTATREAAADYVDVRVVGEDAVLVRARASLTDFGTPLRVWRPAGGEEFEVAGSADWLLYLSQPRLRRFASPGRISTLNERGEPLPDVRLPLEPGEQCTPLGVERAFAWRRVGDAIRTAVFDLGVATPAGAAVMRRDGPTLDAAGLSPTGALVAGSPDGRWVAVWAERPDGDLPGTRLTLIDAERLRLALQQDLPGQPSATVVAFSARGDRLAVCSGTLWLGDLDRPGGATLTSTDLPADRAAWQPGGSRLLVQRYQTHTAATLVIDPAQPEQPIWSQRGPRGRDSARWLSCRRGLLGSGRLVIDRGDAVVVATLPYEPGAGLTVRHAIAEHTLANASLLCNLLATASMLCGFAWLAAAGASVATRGNTAAPAGAGWRYRAGMLLNAVLVAVAVVLPLAVATRAAWPSPYTVTLALVVAAAVAGITLMLITGVGFEAVRAYNRLRRWGSRVRAGAGATPANGEGEAEGEGG